MKKIFSLVAIQLLILGAFAQAKKESTDLKYLFNESGTHYFQVTFLNQLWVRQNQNLTGTTVENEAQTSTFDIGLRRTRMQMFGELNDRVFVYFQFGQNNFNSQYAIGANRKVAAFLHDAVCEYKVTSGLGLKIGGGLTIANGLSRFSQPSIGTIMTMDVPVFAQATVDQTDLFSRKLSVYARGQVGKIDYRFSLSDPFPLTSNGNSLPEISANATFAKIGHHLQQQGYLMYQFFDHENHTTPYMTGTYLGNKKIFNIAVGGIFQKNATWRTEAVGSKKDTVMNNMKLLCVESFLDMPVNKEKGTAINAYVGVFKTDYGKNYLRFNGIMNPASGTTTSNLVKDAGSMYGNAIPMFGTGNVIYSQFGYLCAKDLLKENGQLMPYVSMTSAQYDRLGKDRLNTFNAGVNWFIQGHKAKITLDWQNRPGVLLQTVSGQDAVIKDGRKNAITLQYQVFF